MAEVYICFTTTFAYSTPYICRYADRRRLPRHSHIRTPFPPSPHFLSPCLLNPCRLPPPSPARQYYYLGLYLYHVAELSFLAGGYARNGVVSQSVSQLVDQVS